MRFWLTRQSRIAFRSGRMAKALKKLLRQVAKHGKSDC